MDPALRGIVNDLNKKYGPGTLVKGSDLRSQAIPRITSGSLSLDVILGGGWPANQWHEIYGEFSSGKTALVLQTIAANMALDPEWEVWWVASEHFDVGYAAMCGVDLDRVHVHDTNIMEEAYGWVMKAATTKSIDAIVIDSLAALVPGREDDNNPGELAPGLGALLTNQFFRKQRTATRRSLIEVERPVTGFIINQFREKIGVTYGDARTTPGGKGKAFDCVTRVEVARADWIKDGDEPVGQVIRAKTTKNKSHRPYRTATFDFYFAETTAHHAGSYDSLKEIVNVSIAFDVVKQAGAWFYYGDDKYQGRSGLTDAVRADAVLAATISADVLALTQPKPVAPIPAKEAKATRKAVAKSA